MVSSDGEEGLSQYDQGCIKVRKLKIGAIYLVPESSGHCVWWNNTSRLRSSKDSLIMFLGLEDRDDSPVRGGRITWFHFQFGCKVVTFDVHITEYITEVCGP